MAAASPLNYPTARPILGDWSWLPDPRGALLALLLVASLVAGVALVAELVEGAAARPAASIESAEPARVWPTRVVPVEWRWTPQGVDVDRMFRQRR